MSATVPVTQADKEEARSFVMTYWPKFDGSHTSAQRALAAIISHHRIAHEPAPSPSPAPLPEEVPQSVIDLVVAAREATSTGTLPHDEDRALIQALEPFSEAVPYEDGPDADDEDETPA